jgi:hypothetical protein
MQSQMIGLQSSLDKILTHLQNPPKIYPPSPASATTARFLSTSSGGGGPSPSASFPTTPGGGASTSAIGGLGSSMRVANIIEVGSGANNGTDGNLRLPSLHGFTPRPHKYTTYGIAPDTTSPSDHGSEDTLPGVALNTPTEALQGLANTAAEVAATDQPPYVLSFLSLLPPLCSPSHPLVALYTHLLTLTPSESTVSLNCSTMIPLLHHATLTPFPILHDRLCLSDPQLTLSPSHQIPTEETQTGRTDVF